MSGLAAGDPIGITDGTNTDYVVAEAGTTTTNIVIVSGSLTNSYTANEAKVQLMALQDPEQVPNQIDFSS
jgi:hypothetical protein